MIYDVLGIGFGPSNIALAIAMEESNFSGSVKFIDKNSGPFWQQDMLLDGADIQNNPLRDLITPVNPRSRFSFVNYLHQTGKFFSYLNTGLHYPLRKDFFNYVRWAAEHFSNVDYDVTAQSVRIEQRDESQIWVVDTACGQRYLCRKLVLGTGRKLNIPDIPGLDATSSATHLTRYLPAIASLDREATVAVLGASQSAVEILLDLLDKGFRHVISIHRSFSYRLKDTSPFSDEVYFPEFVDYYHALPAEKRELLDRQVRQTNYSAADHDVIHALNLKIYEDGLDGRLRIRVLRSHEIISACQCLKLGLQVRDIYTDIEENLEVDLLILATGFLDIGRNGKQGLPALIEPLSPLFNWDGNYLEVERDYRIRYRPEADNSPDLYLNGLCESSHGLGDAGSFSLVSLRAKDIVVSIRQRIDSITARNAAISAMA